MHCVFDSAEAKYTCPKCSVKTCSLPCVQRHKVEQQCSGIKPCAFEYISRKEWMAQSASSDATFLQNIHDKLQQPPKSKTRRSKKQLSLIQRVCAAYQIEWRAAPSVMERASKSKTHVSNDELYWTIEIKSKDLLLHKVHAQASLRSILQQYELTPSTIQVHQTLQRHNDCFKRWIDIPSTRWDDSIFHILTYGIMPQESCIIYEYPSLSLAD